METASFDFSINNISLSIKKTPDNTLRSLEYSFQFLDALAHFGVLIVKQPKQRYFNYYLIRSQSHV